MQSTVAVHFLIYYTSSSFIFWDVGIAAVSQEACFVYEGQLMTWLPRGSVQFKMSCSSSFTLIMSLVLEEVFLS